jgi:hypothetical protein
VLLLAGVLTLSANAQSPGGPRTWTSSDGKKIEAILIDADASTVALKTAAGLFKLPVSRLSAEDQAYLTTWRGQAPQKLAPWPEKVETTGDLKIEEKEIGEEFSYFSPHFEFRSPLRLSNSVVREFARLFEATYEGVKALPVGFDPMPPQEGGHFLTKLFANREAYFAAGGLPGSGGMFSSVSRGREFVSGSISVPLTSLGVEQVGNRYIIDPDKDSGTLVHEITHQVAVMWGIYGAPIWFTEGIAEYMQSAPYSKGTMRFSNMTGNVEKTVMERANGNEFQMLPVEKLMTISRDEWANLLVNGDAAKNYHSANVLMTYFLHLDGSGTGEAVAAYLRDLRAGTDPRQAAATHLLRDRDLPKLAADVREKWRQNGFRLEYAP